MKEKQNNRDFAQLREMGVSRKMLKFDEMEKNANLVEEYSLVLVFSLMCIPSSLTISAFRPILAKLMGLWRNQTLNSSRMKLPT